SGDNGDAFAMLEQRIAALNSTLEGRERPAASENSEHIESALRALSERIDRMPVGNDNASAFAHLEQRVSYLLERIETSTDPRAAAFVEAPFETPRAAMPLPPKPELPNPAVAQGLEPKAYQEHFVAAPREFHAAESSAPFTPPAPPRAISEILLPHAAPARAAIESELPPDHPLEPGTRPAARSSSPSERIAASENALSEIPTGPKEPVSTSSFIAAARRAAQAAAASAPSEKAAKKTPADKAREKAKAKIEAKAAAKPAAKADGKEPSTITSKIRSLLVGASVVVIVLSTFKIAMTLLDTGSVPPMPAMEEPAPAQLPTDSNAAPAMPAPAAPSITSPTPIGRQSNH